MNTDAPSSKLKNVMQGKGGAAAKYFALTYGEMPLWKAVLMEITVILFSGASGSWGLFLRSILYRPFFGKFGKGVVIGKNVVFRHPGKIKLGDGVTVDDNAMVDAKGSVNKGVSLGAGVYIGRNSIVYCKEGNIELEEGVNISSNCVVFSSNDLKIGAETMIGAYTYILSGGEYDHQSPLPFARQTGMETRGPLSIGADCWLGARVTVLDGANIGNRCVLGAGTVVTKPIPELSLAVGVPAKVVGSVLPAEKNEEAEAAQV
ncbi:MAG: hypothetical protein GX804_11290 [Lentisphaerae bacterium]|nr:hypothetical protein [Lentisphaerota bacterium]